MSQVNFEQVLLQVKALPPEDLAKLREYLKAQSEEEKAIEAARALARAASKRDLSAEYRWLREHGEEYVGQWVALKGDQLIIKTGLGTHQFLIDVLTIYYDRQGYVILNPHPAADLANGTRVKLGYTGKREPFRVVSVEILK